MIEQAGTTARRRRGPVAWLALAAFIAWSFSAGLIGTALSGGSMGGSGWYASLDKPFFTPPGWLFGPVWSALYLAMGVAAWLVWRREGIGLALGLFAFQWALNAAWSGLFFGQQNPLAGLFDIVLLWIVLAATVWVFFRADRAAGALMTPYLGWVSFAAALNFAIWWLNRG